MTVTHRSNSSSCWEAPTVLCKLSSATDFILIIALTDLLTLKIQLPLILPAKIDLFGKNRELQGLGASVMANHGKSTEQRRRMCLYRGMGSCKGCVNSEATGVNRGMTCSSFSLAESGSFSLVELLQGQEKISSSCWGVRGLFRLAKQGKA